MKKVLSFAMSMAMIAALGTTAYGAEGEAADTATGNADLVLEEGKLQIIPSASIPSLSETFHEIGVLELDFGSHKLSGDLEEYENEHEKPLGIVIQDARGYGKASTWSLTADLSDFKLVSDGTPTLAGTQLKLEPDVDSLVPGIVPAGTSKPILTEKVTLNAGDDSGVLILKSASEENNGSAGMWGVNWDAKLQVPGSAVVGTHQAKLTWTLTAGV